MSRVDLRLPAAIDELEAGHGATLVVSAKNDPTKHALLDNT
jgi:hypothetical protein